MNGLWTAPLLALLPALTPVASAQEQKSDLPQPSAEALQRLEDLSDEIDEFVDEWRAEQAEIQRKAREEAKKAEEEGRPLPAMPAMMMRPDFGPFVERLIGWADEAGGEDAALYLTRAVELGGFGEGSMGRDALDLLVSRHPASPSWKNLGRYLPGLGRQLGEERGEEILALLEKSPDGDVRAWVAMARHGATIESAGKDTAEYKAAKRALLAAKAEASDAGVIDEIQGAIDLRELLGVGAKAPDIEGLDLDGVEFKLSDYEGKVVFLDFWGDW